MFEQLHDSSTIIILKFLTDNRDTETLYGKLAVGILIIQDLVAIIVLMLMSSISQGGELGLILIETAIKGSILVAILVPLSIYVLPRLTKWVAKSQEFLLLFSLAWCLALAALFFGLNFSMEVGALIAGISLGMSPYRHEISSRLRPLRDFFLILFFIILGTQAAFTNVSIYVIPIVVLSIFTLIFKPLIVIITLSFLGYSRRTNFFTGVSMAQISEFSIIVIVLGVTIGQISTEILSMITIIGLITIAGSTYMMKYSPKIYPILSKYLALIETKGKKKG